MSCLMSSSVDAFGAVEQATAVGSWPARRSLMVSKAESRSVSDTELAPEGSWTFTASALALITPGVLL